jgi:hypothetical protein
MQEQTRLAALALLRGKGFTKEEADDLLSSALREARIGRSAVICRERQAGKSAASGETADQDSEGDERLHVNHDDLRSKLPDKYRHVIDVLDRLGWVFPTLSCSKEVGRAVAGAQSSGASPLSLICCVHMGAGHRGYGTYQG